MSTHLPLVGITVSARVSTGGGPPFLAVRDTYAHAVTLAGGAPVLIPFHLEQDVLLSIYNRLDAVVLSGGGDLDPATYGDKTTSPHTTDIDPDRDHVELALARRAVQDDKPLLAICRGIQVLNVALGGTLIQHISAETVAGALDHEAPSEEWFSRLRHDINVDPGSRLHAALGIEGSHLTVNSLHHQALADVAPGLAVVARAADGIIEGVEMADRRFIVGVQWHPEALVDEHPPNRHLFEALVRAAA